MFTIYNTVKENDTKIYNALIFISLLSSSSALMLSQMRNCFSFNLTFIYYMITECRNQL